MFQNKQFQHYQSYNGGGHETELTSDDPHEKSNPRYTKWDSRGEILSEGFNFLRKLPTIGSVAKLRHFVTVQRIT